MLLYRAVRLQFAAQLEVCAAVALERRDRLLRRAGSLEHEEPRVRRKALCVGPRRLAEEILGCVRRLRLRHEDAIAQRIHEDARILDELLHRRALPFLHHRVGIGLLGQRLAASARADNLVEPMLQIPYERLVQVAPEEADGKIPIVGLLAALGVADVLAQALPDVLRLADVKPLGAIFALAEEKVHAGALKVFALARGDVSAIDLYRLAVPVRKFGNDQPFCRSICQIKFNAFTVVHFYIVGVQSWSWRVRGSEAGVRGQESVVRGQSRD